MNNRQSAALALVVIILVLAMVAYQQYTANSAADQAVRDSACRRGFTEMCR